MNWILLPLYDSFRTYQKKFLRKETTPGDEIQFVVDYLLPVLDLLVTITSQVGWPSCFAALLTSYRALLAGTFHGYFTFGNRGWHEAKTFISFI